MKKYILALASVLLLSACAGGQVRSTLEGDNALNCRQLAYEINDAQFWNRIAQDNIKAGNPNTQWPLEYVSDGTTCRQVCDVTQARIAHLKALHAEKNCPALKK